MRAWKPYRNYMTMLDYTRAMAFYLDTSQCTFSGSSSGTFRMSLGICYNFSKEPTLGWLGLASFDAFAHLNIASIESSTIIGTSFCRDFCQRNFKKPRETQEQMGPLLVFVGYQAWVFDPVMVLHREWNTHTHKHRKKVSLILFVSFLANWNWI